MKRLLKFSQILSEKIILLSSLMLFASVSILVVQVFTRYVFGFSFPWSEELTRYMVVYFALLSAAVLVRERDHITVNYFFERMPAKLRYLLRLFFDFCIFATMVVWIVVGANTADFMRFMQSSGIGITMFWPYLAIPISGLFFCFFVVLNFIEDLSNPDRFGKSGESPKLKDGAQV